MDIEKECIVCHKHYIAHSNKSLVCSSLCAKVNRTHIHFNTNTEYIECKECGFRAKQLLLHIEKVHHISIDDYCKKHNCIRYDLTIESIHKLMSKNILKACNEGRCGWQKSGKNPSKSDDVKNGRKSIFSKNYKGYDGLSDEEKELKIKTVISNIVEKMNNRHNNALRLDYYTSRGYSIEEAKKLLSDRQCTFSLKICIKKYGKEKGTNIFNERQLRWQNTLNSKPIEEIERINRAKTKSISSLCAYSKISQKLFNALYEKIKNSYNNIFYATIKDGIPNSYKNNEYEVILSDLIHRYFLDFYIKDNNKVIEFDGDYWHGEKRGNKERDKKREDNLKRLGFVNIMHVKERDYNANPNKVIQECLEFIRK